MILVLQFLALDVKARLDLVDVLSNFKGVSLGHLIPLQEGFKVLGSLLLGDRGVAHHLDEVFVHVDSLMGLLDELNPKLFHYHFVKFFDGSQV